MVRGWLRDSKPEGTGKVRCSYVVATGKVRGSKPYVSNTSLSLFREKILFLFYAELSYRLKTVLFYWIFPLSKVFIFSNFVFF